MNDQPQVERCADAEALARTVARRTVQTLADALAQRQVAHLVVTGGSILEKVFAALADRHALDWSRVHVWWGDERFVPAGSQDRNDAPADAALFDLVPAVQHRMPASDGPFGDDVDAAARGYAEELAGFAADGSAVPAFDVALIGLGPDGHCCSLFPHHPGLTVIDQPVAAVRESPKPPPTRITLTFPTLEAVRNLWFVASGEAKADAVARALGGASRQDVPSGSVRGSHATVWMLDTPAASKLA